MGGEVKPIVRLAIPLVIGQLGQMLLGLTDTVVLTHVGKVELGALAFSNNLFYVPFVFGMGLLTCISVKTSYARGSDEPAKARGACRHGVLISLLLGVLIFLASLLLAPHIAWFGQPKEVEQLARPFFLVIMASMIPALLSTALKNHADALARPWGPFWISMAGVALNVFLNIGWVFGKFGMPHWGYMGAAWATFVTRVLMALGIWLWLVKMPIFRGWVPTHWIKLPVWSELRDMWKIGWPASLQSLTEVTAFSISGILAGQLGEIALASHQIALSCAGTAFMIPLGLSMALTVRMGEVVGGASDAARLRKLAITGLWMAGICTAFTCSILLIFSRDFVTKFGASAEVVDVAANLLMIVGIFQIVDGLQVAAAGMLRGLHDTKWPAMMGFVSYWLIGLPLAYTLAFHTRLHVSGVWWALALALGIASVFFTRRLMRMTSPEVWAMRQKSMDSEEPSPS